MTMRSSHGEGKDVHKPIKKYKQQRAQDVKNIAVGGLTLCGGYITCGLLHILKALRPWLKECLPAFCGCHMWWN
jgi:hypothetical protein